MRESNHAFPAQNRACVCIASQLYDRRALDTTSPLPLFNSLTHLTYLTSTSPRIREIVIMDGGLERLVRLMRDFCALPPPPEAPSQFYGLIPPNPSPKHPHHTLSMQVPYDPKRPFDRAAAYRFSLAFQCIVNIGVRGSEPIRARVVQAGTLDVVGCVLEGWLASKGFAIAPSASASGVARETREERQARRLAIAEMRQREIQTVQAQQLTRALQWQVATIRRIDDDEEMPDADRGRINTPPNEFDHNTTITSSSSPSPPPHPATSDTSNDTSPSSTPHGGSTPTGAVVVPGRDRSGTVVARSVWDLSNNRDRERHPSESHATRRRSTIRAVAPIPGGSNAATRTDTEPESDADAEMEDPSASSPGSTPGPVPASPTASASIPPPVSVGSSTAPTPPEQQQQRRAVGIVGDDDAAALEVGMNIDLLLAGVNDGFVALEQNVGDDLAMGAPPGAPGNININMDMDMIRRDLDMAADADRGERESERERMEDLTPRAGFVSLPEPHPHQHPHHHAHPHHPHPHAHAHTHATVPQHPHPLPRPQFAPTPAAPSPIPLSHTHETGPYREEDVLLSLQLLAYLSKYPHVRQAFYKPRAMFNPALQASYPHGAAAQSAPPPVTKEPTPSFFRALAGAAVGRGKDKDKSRSATSNATPDSATSNSRSTPALTQSTNMFSLVERFTFRPSPNETLLALPPPLLPPEIQHWAGVVMRNACRKDGSRGGIRQCANMTCGKWESYPREFAKCRRCRKAKYCGKECQSRAWAEGHRFWCCAKEEDKEEEGESSGAITGQDVVDADGGVHNEGTVRLTANTGPNAEHVRVSVGNHIYTPTPAGPSRPPISNTTPTATTASGASRTISTSTTATTTLYRTEHAGRGPSLGHAAYTRHRVNAIPPQAMVPPVTLPQHPHQHARPPYLQVAGAPATATARRRAGTTPGPSVVTPDLPRTLLHDESSMQVSGQGQAAGVMRPPIARRPHASGQERESDDMVLG